MANRFTDYEIDTEMTAYDVEATIARCAQAKASTQYVCAVDPYQWWLWRYAPVPDWKLWKLLHPEGNPGPYGTPVYASIAGTLAGLTKTTSETNEAFQRRCLHTLGEYAEEN